MALYQLTSEQLIKVKETTFIEQGVKERYDLQRVLADDIFIIADDLFVITEEFGDWEDSRRRIDILAIDKDAKLVVVELKRTQDGGHMELQAIRYAAMVSTMTFMQVVAARKAYIEKKDYNGNAEEEILAFLGWDEADEDLFANDVRIILLSEEFSKEITTSVLWLNSRDLDITCYRLKPYFMNSKLLLDIQQIIPLPEAKEYQIKVKEKDQRQRIQKRQKKTLSEIWQELNNNRPKEEYEIAKSIYDWIEPLVSRIFTTKVGFGPVLRVHDRDQFLFKISTDGKVQISLYYLSKQEPFSDENLRKELLHRLNQIQGIDIPLSSIKGKPKFPLVCLNSDDSMRQFREIFEWVISRIKENSVEC